MKFEEPIYIKLSPKYSVMEPLESFEDFTEGIPKDPRFNTYNEEANQYSGGKFDWGIMRLPENNQEKMEHKVNLMRLWCTTMYTQMASGLAYTDQRGNDLKVTLTDEEIDVLSKINSKICQTIFNEMDFNEKSLIKKKNMGKIQF